MGAIDIAQLPSAPQQNPDYVYITCPFLVANHGFVIGEQVSVTWKVINHPDANGFDIWVNSKNSRNPRPISLIPSQYSLTPLNAPTA